LIALTFCFKLRVFIKLNSTTILLRIECDAEFVVYPGEALTGCDSDGRKFWTAGQSVTRYSSAYVWRVMSRNMSSDTVTAMTYANWCSRYYRSSYWAVPSALGECAIVAQENRCAYEWRTEDCSY